MSKVEGEFNYKKFVLHLDVWKFESPPDILFEEISKIIKDEL